MGSAVASKINNGGGGKSSPTFTSFEKLPCERKNDDAAILTTVNNNPVSKITVVALFLSQTGFAYLDVPYARNVIQAPVEVRMNFFLRQ